VIRVEIFSLLYLYGNAYTQAGFISPSVILSIISHFDDRCLIALCESQIITLMLHNKLTQRG
jgi:hypothetical protein